MSWLTRPLPNSRRATCVAFVLTCATLGGCAGDDARNDDADSSPAAAPLDTPAAGTAPTVNLSACEALPAAEVRSVIAAVTRDSLAIDVPASTEGGRMSACNYASSANPVVATFQLNVSPTGEFTTTSRTGARDALEEVAPVEHIAGLGEAAFWGSGQLHVFVNRNYYMIFSADNRDHAQQLAQRVLPRLR